MNIEQLVDDEIKYELEGLREIEWGTKEYESTVKGITELVSKSIELKKVEIESDEKIKDRELKIKEQELKKHQIKIDNNDRIVKNILTAAGIVIPFTVTIWGTLKSLKFEETGTVTTIIGRGFINKLLPTKK